LAGPKIKPITWERGQLS